MRPTSGRQRSWLVGIAVLGVAALLGVAVFFGMLRRWTDVQRHTPTDAAAAFAQQLHDLDDARPYIEIKTDGSVSVHRELERPSPIDLVALCVLAWDPRTEHLARVRFPFWFVQVKTTDAINLGTLTTLLAHDWEHLDLRVSTEDLERRGPGLVLDHESGDGRRVLLWTERAAPSQ